MVTKLTAFLLKLSDDPLTFCVPTGWTLKGSLEACQKQARARKFNVLIVPYWDVATDLEELVRVAGVASSRYNISGLCFMCPSEVSARLLRSRGLQTIHAHQNAFIDETVFYPDPEIKKKYRAVHNAAMTSFKRHHLAWGVENIAVVTYRHQATDDSSSIRSYRSLAYTNLQDDGSVRFLGDRELANVLRQAQVGIILSAIEGANFASGEYQFCGLPVVSTRAKGGRLDFLDREFLSLVFPLEWHVNFAVKRWNVTPTDSQLIAQRTIERAIPHRIRLINWLSELTGSNQLAKANKNAWLPAFKGRLRESFPVDGETYEILK